MIAIGGGQYSFRASCVFFRTCLDKSARRKQRVVGMDAYSAENQRVGVCVRRDFQLKPKKKEAFRHLFSPPSIVHQNTFSSRTHDRRCTHNISASLPKRRLGRIAAPKQLPARHKSTLHSYNPYSHHEVSLVFRSIQTGAVASSRPERVILYCRRDVFHVFICRERKWSACRTTDPCYP